jgi:anti-sigma-K factor RskA
VFGWGGWAVAALLLVTIWAGRPGSTPEPGTPPTVAEARVALLGLSETVQTPWGDSAWEEFDDVQGDVVWNDDLQEGYLRLANMPANDPTRTQYQLWIVDPARDEEPVDGGVFDIPPGAREVVVPIQAKLPVRSPAAFAITREQPGGVVVSEGPLLVVASRG